MSQSYINGIGCDPHVTTKEATLVLIRSHEGVDEWGNVSEENSASSNTPPHK